MPIAANPLNCKLAYPPAVAFSPLQRGTTGSVFHNAQLLIRITAMTAELETGLPSFRQLQTLIRDDSEVELKLITGDLLHGKIRWQDSHCIGLIDQYDQPTIVWRHSLAYLKPRL